MENFYRPPLLENRVICITNNPILGASISSYFSEPNTYFVIFKFPDVQKKGSLNSTADRFMSDVMGTEIATLITNSMYLLKPERVIFADLNDNQKSFLTSIPHEMIINVTPNDNLDEKLSFLNRKFSGEIKCKSDQAAEGLIYAKRERARLVIDNEAETFQNGDDLPTDGVVIIEDDHDVSSVIAANYAFSIGAKPVFVEPLPRNRINEIQRSLFNWGKSSSTVDFDKIGKEVSKRIAGITFDKYKFATFFTNGLPYGLILKNCLPVSHVYRSLREDLFIFNNILFETERKYGSAIVFSPEEFSDEETQDVVAILSKHNLHVKKLIGKSATVSNFHNSAGHYPYDLMHICSHGGETNGYYVIEKFLDRENKEHTVEYHEIVGFGPIPGQKLIPVHRKIIFRKFDGFKWMSSELEQQNIPPFVFLDLEKNLREKGISTEAKRMRVEEPIPNSCHIKCYDSIHQGVFTHIASHGSPVVFNNTCASWSDISECFIAAGCRGYIGTLWNIDNVIATVSARAFYQALFERNVINAFFKMVKSTNSSLDKDIYIFWGLHFSTIKKPGVPGNLSVLQELIRSVYLWMDFIHRVEIPELRRNAREILCYVLNEIANNFEKEDFRNLGDLLTGKEDETKGTPLPLDQKEADLQRRGILDLPADEEKSG